jgi:hypothetical protein
LRDTDAPITVITYAPCHLSVAPEPPSVTPTLAREVVYDGEHLAIYANTPNRAAAYQMFRGFSDPEFLYGTVSNPGRQAIARLPALLASIDGEITIEAMFSNDVAATVTERVPCDAWQIDDVLYDPDSGILSTFRLYPVSDEQAAEWRAKIDAALARAA